MNKFYMIEKSDKQTNIVSYIKHPSVIYKFSPPVFDWSEFIYSRLNNDRYQQPSIYNARPGTKIFLNEDSSAVYHIHALNEKHPLVKDYIAERRLRKKLDKINEQISVFIPMDKLQKDKATFSEKINTLKTKYERLS